MSNPIVIIGWSADDKVPGFYGETKYGQGRVSVGMFPVAVLITGTKSSDGSMTPDQDIAQIISVDDAIIKLGKHPTATQQARTALSIEGVNLWAAPPLEAAGTASTIAIACTGTATAAGTWKFYLDGHLITVDVALGTVAADAEADIADQFNGWSDGPATAVATTDCVISIASVGTQGGKHLLAWELDEAPTGITFTVIGATALHPQLVPFTAGTGTESVANIINLMKADTWDYIAPAQTDATNLGLFEAHMALEAGPTIGHLEHMVAGASGTLVATQSIAQTTLNDARSSVVWLENSETHPAELAAGVAALRSVIEPQDPNYNYDDVALPFATPQRYKADIAQHATLKAALNTGITPLKTENGVVKITRGIVTRSLDGTAPNYNTLDWGDAIVPDRIRKELAASWTEFKAANPRVGRDIVAGERSQPSGVGTPNLWNAEVNRVLRDAEDKGWIQNVDDNPPQTVLDTTRRALVCAVPVEVCWLQHSLGVSVRQQAAA